MPKPHGAHAPSRRPTPYPDLNAVLAELVERVRALLADNLVGIYLQGSFALGDFDERSDLDFVVVIHQDIPPEQQPALQAMHDALHALPSPWARKLEGSYAPKAILRRRSLTPRDPPGEPRPDDWADPGASGLPPRVYPFLHLRNAHRVLVRSEHDNTEVVRWILREKGVVLFGPSPLGLIDPVTPEALREDVRELLGKLEPMAADGTMVEPRWIQCFMALMFARMLYAVTTGKVASKKTAVAFARRTLEPRFAALVERAFTEREGRPADEADLAAYFAQAADPAEAAPTLELFRHTLAVAEPRPARSAIEQKLAQKRQPPPGRGDWRGGLNPRGPSARSWTPPPTRPGGRGRRG
ncbi:MAG TPA: aminoglycoside adenylyltransferase domain-containing protein [Caulobacteraceae bacterium]|jgi:predicted nucleotidyltransferase|nr:aminoglycoside adenylyltransferase domain-containing protein [Caulobacteraceae bacterium]